MPAAAQMRRRGSGRPSLDDGGATALKDADRPEGGRERQGPEQDRAKTDRAEHASRTVGGADKRQRHGPERRTAPVEDGRKDREAEIVEGCVREEEEADEEPHRPADQTEEGQEFRAGSGQLEGAGKRVPEQREQSPDAPGVERREHHAVAQDQPHAIEPAGAPILAENRSDRAREREQPA